jgi:hypothetical protein
MKVMLCVRAYLAAGCLGVVMQGQLGFAQSRPEAAKSSAQPAGAERDGQYDFDFEVGTWKTHLRRLVHPLTGSTTWVEMEGTSVVRKVWNGRANLLELEVDGAGGHLEGLSLRLCNPQSHRRSGPWGDGLAQVLGRALQEVAQNGDFGGDAGFDGGFGVGGEKRGMVRRQDRASGFGFA